MSSVEKVVGSDVVLFWLDDYIGQANNCIALKQEFQSNTTNIYLFHDAEQCRRFLPSIKHKKLFCIVQGKYAKTIIPDIVQYAVDPVVYIFCFDMTHLTKWAEDYQCILDGGFFDHEKTLLTRLTNDLADYAYLKFQEHSVKRAACEEWAETLSNNAKRFRTEQCTLTFCKDPLSDQETISQQPNE